MVQTQHKRPAKAFFGVVIFGFALYYAMTALQPHLGAYLFDYNTWEREMVTSSGYRFLWMIGDATEPFFHKAILGGVGVFIGSVIAYVLDRQQSKYRGTPISYGQGRIWPWIFAASFISLGISIILFGSVRANEPWVATFAPYVSVAASIILLYGANIRSLLTGAILGAVFTTPIATAVRLHFCQPWELPGVIGSVTGMWLGGIIVYEICRLLPWMKDMHHIPDTIRPAKGELPVDAYKKRYPNKYFIRRMLADYSEPMFVGNEIAGACLIIGTLLTWALNPLQPYYGTGWLAACLLSQILTGAIAMYFYWDGWMKEGAFFPTFVPVVSVAPAMVLAFGPTMPIIISSAVLGGFSSPAVAVIVNEHIPSHWHPMVGFTFSMALCSFAVGVFLQFLIQAFPMLGM